MTIEAYHASQKAKIALVLLLTCKRNKFVHCLLVTRRIPNPWVCDTQEFLDKDFFKLKK